MSAEGVVAGPPLLEDVPLLSPSPSPLFAGIVHFASSSGWAVVYSGDEFGIGDEAILCVCRFNKTLIVDKFRHISSAVFVLSVYFVLDRICSSSFGLKGDARLDS